MQISVSIKFHGCSIKYKVISIPKHHRKPDIPKDGVSVDASDTRNPISGKAITDSI